MLSLTLREKPEKSVLLRKKKMMDQGRKPILVGIALVMLLGIAIYLRLWTIDYSITSNEADLIRRQFDLANREAMDESAEWRRKYDEEVERAIKCTREIMEIKKSSEKVENATSIKQKLEILQKENMALLKQVDTLRRELEAEKLKCHS
ncbi:hypothetical protein CFOL_v3_08194 [Cephalotus follicularis]|uniref:Uncharacterized protein n=1 Tax=Cephalotus follicularis TaxID=3775 RepID=A0A1Q3B9E6_CEPFO|nr:hypothetical protein CFOL_v3_08194 [Cephalotus follicularis]